MPQSIELSNAMDVSNAQEAGKGVTIDGDFVTVENNQQDTRQEDQNSQNSTQNEVADFEQEQQVIQHERQEEVDYAPTFAQIKRGILTAKSPAHLDVLEEQAMDHADKGERKKLMQFIKAQAQKFQPAAEVTSAKKPEQVKEEAPPAEAAPAKKTQARQPKATAAEENKLTDAAESQTPPVVNEIKSNAIAGGLKISIQDAANLDTLATIAQNIRDSKPKLTQDHLDDVLNVYAARKKFLEDQQNMFAGVPEVSFFDSALARIRNAKSQDDINEVYADPAFDELSGENRERLDKEAQQRESELQD